VDALIVESLRAGGFETVQRLRVAPDRTRDRSTGPREQVTVSLALDIADDEDAVVLAETEGCYRWVRPRHETASRDATGTGRVAVFDLVIPATTSASRSIGGLPAGELRATVLSYAAPLLARAAIRALEVFVQPGLVHITSPDPAQWQRLDSLDELGLDASRTHRLLLFVHGTFDDTAGAFGALTATDPGRAFLTSALSAYDAVLGFDHRTLSVDPLENARDLAQRLAAFPAQQPVSIDVVCHSRGGLTSRSFVEEVLPQLPWRAAVDRVVFVAATNAGTSFADPSRWADFADVYTNLVVAKGRLLADLPGGGAVASAALGALRGIGALVKWLASFATDPDSVPGIAAMVPDGPFVKTINEDQPGQPRPGTPWFVVSSDFEATVASHPREIPAAVISRLVNGVVDQVFDSANDLVVDDDSMRAIDLAHGGGYVRDELALGANSVVYHTNYFAQSAVCLALSSWLLQRVDRLDSAPAPTPSPPSRRPASPSLRHQRGPDRADADTQAPPVEGEPRAVEAQPPARPDAETPVTERLSANLAAELPQHPPVGVVTTLRVRMSRTTLAATEGTASAHTVLSVLPDRPVDVQVIPSLNAVLDGPDLDRLLLPPGGGWAELQFALHPTAPGPMRLTVLARQGREVLGRLVLATDALDPAEAGDESSSVRAQVEVASTSSPVLADVAWLEIAQQERDGETRFSYALRLPGGEERFTATSPPIRDAQTYVSSLFREVQQLWFDRFDQPARYLEDLQDLGASLFEQLFPQSLQEVLWDHRDELDNLFLLADEPFIPWELVHLKPPRGPREKAPRFLGQLGLVRWQFTPFPPAPSLQARPGKVFAVCPEYADPTLNLTEVQAEADFLATALGATSVRATAQGVRGLLRRRRGFDLLHFSGHGTADPANIGEAKIVLSGRTVGDALVADYLTSTTVAENTRLHNGSGSGPLVVLNACQVGRAGEQLTTLGGFARAFLEAGASAFVSCLWSVNQTPARIFVTTFYQGLLAGETVAAAALAARTAAREQGDATWLAYVIYARPDAVLVRS
jgi:hypothetical protein